MSLLVEKTLAFGINPVSRSTLTFPSVSQESGHPSGSIVVSCLAGFCHEAYKMLAQSVLKATSLFSQSNIKPHDDRRTFQVNKAVDRI